MSEVWSKIELIPYELKYLCDNCREDYMKFTGITLMSSPPQYKHECMTCGNIMNLSKVYPCIEYEKYYLTEVE